MATSAFTGGMIYPSGHAANIALSSAVLLYLLRRYEPRWFSMRLVHVAAVMTALTMLDSLYIGSHWVSDLVAGVLVGDLLALLLVGVDRASWLSSRAHTAGGGRVGLPP